MGVSPGDKALDHLIAQMNAAIAMTGDPRIVRLRDLGESLRAQPSEIERMQREQANAARWRHRRSRG